jgi:hypothetical protein
MYINICLSEIILLLELLYVALANEINVNDGAGEDTLVRKI